MTFNHEIPSNSTSIKESEKALEVPVVGTKPTAVQKDSVERTIQCVVAGKTLGTAHPSDLSKLFHADCVAGQQLYSSLLDPSFLNISKEVKDRSSESNTSTSKKISGTKDIHTNVFAVLADNTCGDDNLKNSDYDTSNNDEDLGNFFAMTPDAENAQPIEHHPGYGYNMLVIVSGVISGYQQDVSHHC